ncbi:MAG: TIGR03663 family protein [Calditrichaeota bacterium]|nr:TIGR03663 family protein [Calditrichota bacterium]
MKQIYFKYSLMILIIFVALLLRTWDLDLRPMHGDEAINAFKLADLLIENQYNYNPNEYHGPALYYFSLPFLWTGNINNITEFNAEILRAIPLTFGIGLILLLFVFKTNQTRDHLWFSALIAAVSPAFVFYSRYFIHEMMFVFFTYAFVFSFAGFIEKQSRVMSISSGLFLGLMIATKETWTIIMAAFALTIFILYLFKLIPRDYFRNVLDSKIDWMFMVASTGIVILLFYTSFLNDLNGLSRFLDSFSVYFNRGIQTDQHNYPWYKYLEWILFYRSGGSFFSELFVLLCAIPGIIFVFKNPDTDNFVISGKIIAIFSLLNLMLFSALPYKTPWNMLTFWFGFIVLSGYSLAFFNQKLNQKKQIIFWVLISAGFLQLSWESIRINYVDYDRASNPYAYAQPVREIEELVESVHQIVEKNMEYAGFYSEVIAPGNDYWPLPWYFRDIKNIGWYNHVDTLQAPAPLIIINTALKDDVLYNIYQVPPPGRRVMYMPYRDHSFVVRSGISFDLLIQKNAWDNLN